MTEILTESFCERCGTRYTFESAVPSQRRLSGLKVLGRGLKNFVMSDDASLDEAIAAARSDIDRDATNHQLDAFHRTFSFCMSCRQYTCANCWNETEARCLSCEPLAIEFPADNVAPEEIDPARLLRFMGENAARPDNGAGAVADHDHVEAPAAHVHDPWTAEPAAPLAWPEGFASPPDGGRDASLEPASETPATHTEAGPQGDPWIDARPPASLESDDWAAAEASAGDLTAAAIEAAAPGEVEGTGDVSASIEPTAAEASAEIESADAGVAPGMLGADAPHLPVDEFVRSAADTEPVGSPTPAPAESIGDDVVEHGAADRAATEATEAEPGSSGLADHQTLSDALAAYEAAFVEPSEVTSAVVPTELPANEPATASEPTTTQEPATAEGPAAEPAIAAAEAAAEPEAPAPEPAAASSPEPAVEPEPAAPPTAPSPAAPTDRVVQPVWRTPEAPASPAPQWPTGPRWPTGIPTGGAPAPQPPQVDPLAALMARTSTEAMWAASSQEILQPAAATPPVAGIRSCGNCGISLSATARFCRRCGTSQG